MDMDACRSDTDRSRLAQLVERVTSNDEVSRSSRLMGILFFFFEPSC